MKATIAIADDHHLVRDGIARLLERFNYKVILKAENGLDLIDQLSCSPTLPDVCIMDVRMPRLDGIGATRELAKLWPSIGVIGFSTYDDETTKLAMLNAGAEAYLTKGSDLDELCDCIDMVVKIKKETKSARVEISEITP